VDPQRPPQSPDDFDRLLMASPNDSSIWLQYMAHHLEVGGGMIYLLNWVQHRKVGKTAFLCKAQIFRIL